MIMPNNGSRDTGLCYMNSLKCNTDNELIYQGNK